MEVNKINEFKNELENAYKAKENFSMVPNSELSSLNFRRSIYVSKEIKKGEKFSIKFKSNSTI